MRKFGVVSAEERTSLANSTLKSNQPEELPPELNPDIEATPQLDDEAIQLQNLLDNMNAPRQTPRDNWLEELDLEDMTPEEAAGILDNVITNGMYEESYKMGRMVVRLRTRTTSDADRVIEAIQDFKPETSGTLSHLIARMNLAASLSKFGETQFNFTPPNDGVQEVLEQEFTERYNFLSNLPSQIFFALTQILEKFDRRVQLACDPRAIENF
tara:strand:- start:61108 stop:61746 length:639 start_codon:yes stop_codon:yes gene_type:complete